MAAPKAPVIGGSAKEVSLEESVFAVELKPHLVHETVRAEMNAARAGTKGTKSRGLVAGGRSKPWRQKGTGRARAGTTRAPHWTGGGVAFAAGHAQLRGEGESQGSPHRVPRCALATTRRTARSAILDGSGFDAPSTRKAAELVASWGERPTLLVVNEDEELVVKSFRNLEKVLVVRSRGARGRLARLGALGAHLAGGDAARSRAGRRRDRGGGVGVSLHPNQVLLAPVVSEKSYSLISDRKYTFKVHEDAHKTQIRQAVEELFEVKVASVNIVKVQSKPKRRGFIKGRRPGWKKAIVELKDGYEIEIFEGAAV